MSEYTPITGELRERIGQAEHIIPLSGDSKDTQVRINLAWLKEKLDAIDSIHAQLEREYDELRVKFVNTNRHALHMERENESLKAELDRVLGEQEDRRSCVYYDPERHYCSCHDIDTDGLVELPKDADGVPIHIGDVMEWPTTGETFEVVGIGDGVLFYVEDGKEQADWTGASTKRHHQPDTWESIIYDAMQAGRTDITVDVSPLIARCKALCERTMSGDAE